MAFTTLGQSVARDLALAELVAGDLRLLAMKRCASSVSDISSENSATGRAVLDGDVLGDVRDQRALAHRGPRRQHDQVARLEAAGDVVEVLEARRRAGQRRAVARELLELVDLLVEDVLDRAEVARALVVRDLEERALGVLDQLARLAAAVGDAGPGSRAWTSAGGAAAPAP